MAVNLGNIPIANIYIGNTQIQNVYLGNSLIYSATSLLLTSFPMTTGAAFSLLNISTGVTNVIRIRRSSDNIESNFTASQITDGTLLTFCGGNSGFITAWYDQSGNNAHATQTNAANQPVLVFSGVINIQGGRPAISFNGTTHFLSFNGEVLNKGSFVAFAVVKNNKTTGLGRIFDQSSTNGGALLYNSSTGGDELFGSTSAGNIVITSTPISTNYALQVGQVLSGNSKLRRNGVLIGSNITTFTMSGNTGLSFIIGENSPVNSAANQAFGGNLQALVIYTTNQDTNISGIETAINNIYNIY